MKDDTSNQLSSIVSHITFTQNVIFISIEKKVLSL